MKRSPILADHVQRAHTLATFGAAKLVKDLAGKLSIVGGTPEDRKEAEEWVATFLKEPDTGGNG